MRKIRKMLKNSEFQTFNFHGQIRGNVNAGGSVDNQNYTENNYIQNSDLLKSLDEIKKFATNLQQHKTFTKEQQLEIIEAEFEKIKGKEPKKWRRLMEGLSVVFEGGVEAAKAFNPWAGIPIEMLRKIYEIYTGNCKNLPNRHD